MQVPAGFGMVQPQASVLDNYLKLKQARKNAELQAMQMQAYQEQSAARAKEMQWAEEDRAAQQAALQQEQSQAGIETAANQAAQIIRSKRYDMLQPQHIEAMSAKLGIPADHPAFQSFQGGITPEMEPNLMKIADMIAPEKRVELSEGEILGTESGNVILENPKTFAPDKPGSLEKDTEYLAGVLGITDPKKKAELASQLRGKGFSVELPDGTKIQMGGMGATTPTQSQMTTQNELWQEYDSTIKNVEEMLVAIEKDPSLVGAMGSVRKAAQTTAGVVEDIASVIPGVGKAWESVSNIIAKDTQLADKKASFANDPQLSQLRLFENDLGLALARSRHPTGRIPVDIINRSIRDAQLTGLTSSKDVINRMRKILEELKENQKNVEEVMQGRMDKPRKRRFIPGQGLVEVQDE